MKNNLLKNPKVKVSLNKQQIKIIANIAMLIDHVSLILISNETLLYTVGRSVGRIAFPVFAFFIADGYSKTTNVRKYIGRLAILAVISQLPFYLMVETFKLNVCFTLMLGLVLIWATDSIIKTNKKTVVYLLYCLLVFIFGIIAQALSFDYGYCGVTTIFLFYTIPKLFKSKFITIMIVWVFLVMYDTSEVMALFGLLLLLLYNEKKTIKKISKNHYDYCFYPVHLIILDALKFIIL